MYTRMQCQFTNGCWFIFQVEAGSDAPSESKVDQRAVLPAENGLSHTPIIAPKPPSLTGHQPQSAGNESCAEAKMSHEEDD